MQTLWQDLRYAVRMFRKSPGLTLVAMFSIALGIAANTSVFTMTNALLFKPMPVAHPEQLVALYTTTPDSNQLGGFSYPAYKNYRDHNAVFGDLFIHYGTAVSLKYGGDKAELIWSELVTGNYFTGLGVRPAEGRLLSPDDDLAPGARPVVVLSNAFWRQRFAADKGVVGKVLRLNGHDFTIIGVALDGFSGTRLAGFIPDVWVPLMMHEQIIPDSRGLLEARGGQSFNVNGRLRPGVTIEQATAAMNTYASRLAQTYPQTDANTTVGMVAAGNKTQPEITLMGFVPIVTGLMMGIVGLVLLIACANVANLLLARASARRREIAIRLALGASRLRLIRQLLAESILLALAGGGLGVLLSSWFNELIPLASPKLDFAVLDFNYDLSLDYRVLCFTLVLSMLTGIIFGLMPALQASKPDLVQTLKGDIAQAATGRRKFNLRNALVVTQVGLSLMLLVSAGLFIKSMQNAQELSPGFETKNILLASVDVGLQGYEETKGRDFFKQSLERIKTLPGVEAVSMAAPLPLDAYNYNAGVTIEGYVPRYENERLEVGYSIVGDDYFETMKTQIIEGRAFTERDDEKSPPVVIINETMAQRYWPAQNPIGKRLRLGGPKNPYLEVAGIARDGKYYLLGEPPTDYMFLPFRQRYNGNMTFIARTAGSPENLAAALRQEIAGLDSELPVYGIKTMPRFLDRLLSGPKTIAALVSIFGLIALLMASVGLYSVMSYAVAQRTREIGIRMALGAGRSDVLKMVVRQGMSLALVGVVIGLASALALTRLMTSLLYGVSATDPAIFIMLSLVLAGVALVACFVPARRAAKVDPMVALRYE